MQKQSQPFLSASTCISLSEELHNTEQVNCLNCVEAFETGLNYVKTVLFKLLKVYLRSIFKVEPLKWIKG